MHAPPTAVPQPGSRLAYTTARAMSSPPGGGGGVTNSFTPLVLAPLFVLFLMKRNPPPPALDLFVLACRCSLPLSEEDEDEDVSSGAEGRGEEEMSWDRRTERQMNKSLKAAAEAYGSCGCRERMCRTSLSSSNSSVELATKIEAA